MTGLWSVERKRGAIHEYYLSLYLMILAIYLSTFPAPLIVLTGSQR
jgi:hypothetical protein